MIARAAGGNRNQMMWMNIQRSRENDVNSIGRWRRRRQIDHIPNLDNVDGHQMQGLDAVSDLVQVLISPTTTRGEKEYAIMVLGNISIQSLTARDHILDQGVIPLMLQLLIFLPEGAPYCVLPSIYSTVSWCLFNLLRPPSPSPEMILPLFPTLRNLLEIREERIMSDVFWILAFVSEGSDQISQFIVDQNLVPILLEVPQYIYDEPIVLEPALRVLGYIAIGNIQRIEFLVESGLLREIYDLFTTTIASKWDWDEAISFTPDRSCFHVACWILVQIIVGGTEQVLQAVMDANILDLLLRLTLAENPIKEEAAWALCQAAIRASNGQIQAMVEEGFVLHLCNLISLPNQILRHQMLSSRCTEACIEALDAILKVHIESGEFMALCGGWVKIKSLSINGDSPQIRQRASALVENYWDDGYNMMNHELRFGDPLFSLKSPL